MVTDFCQVLAGLAMIGDHTLAELSHGWIHGFVRGNLAEAYLHHAAASSRLREFEISGRELAAILTTIGGAR
jgi:hypothetical protein